MCGIFSMIIRPTTKERDYDQLRALVSALALHSADRGTDATGLALVQSHGDYVTMVKEAKPSYEMIRKKSWRETLAQLGPNTHYILGHTRKATRGENESRNAHPFQFDYGNGTLVGVHNGTVTNSDKLNPEDTFAVDSANVYKVLADTKDKLWEPVLEKLEGTFALCWYADGRMYVGRNFGSPLEVTNVGELDVTLFTSTEHMAKAACALVGVNGVYPTSVAAGQLRTYSWMTQVMEQKDFKVASVKTRSTYTTPVSSPHYAWHGRHQHYQPGIWEQAMMEDMGRGRRSSDRMAEGFVRCQDCATVDSIEKMEQYGTNKWLCDYCFAVAESSTARMD